MFRAARAAGIISFPVALSWVVSVRRAELFAAWFPALVPGSGPVLRFHAYAFALVLLLALFSFRPFQYFSQACSNPVRVSAML
jgi:hypothetical protein